ncbi:TPA: DUF3265 domain-containing protein [Vibrio vulnificus]|nr:DUF3265 domain-containing protein [Vibrio vulnificus]
MVFGGESGLRKVGLGGIHPLTQRYIVFGVQRLEIDEIMALIRAIIFDHSCNVENDNDLFAIVSVNTSDAYNSIMDSFYLLEDTQLAKHSFLERNSSLSIGELYLYFYGVLNAVYMQQQALLVLLRKMGIEFELSELQGCTIFDIRNSFAAHSANRGGKKVKEHSFVLNRRALRQGKLKGYSANHESGFLSHDTDVSTLISEWDKVISKYLESIFNMVKENYEATI